MTNFLRLSLEIKCDDEDDDVLLAKKKDIRVVRVNTAQISSFRPSKDKKDTELFLSGGEQYLLNIKADKFEDLIAETDNIFTLSPNAN